MFDAGDHIGIIGTFYILSWRVSEWFYRGSSQVFESDLWDQSIHCIGLWVWSNPRFIDSFDSHYSKLADIDLQNRIHLYFSCPDCVWLFIQWRSITIIQFIYHSCYNLITHFSISYPVTKALPTIHHLNSDLNINRFDKY